MVKKFLVSATATATESAEDLVILEESSDLSYWEFINQSDADSDTESLHSVENGFLSWYSLTGRPKSPNTHQEIQTQAPLVDRDLVDASNSQDDGDQYDNYHQPIVLPGVGFGLHVDVDVDYEEEGGGGGEKEEEEEEDDDDDDGYGYGNGLNDELVPWHLSGKLGRQRMRKLGKRVFSKMGNSKRNPYSYVKPGCVHGKHGLGTKA